MLDMGHLVSCYKRSVAHLLMIIKKLGDLDKNSYDQKELLREFNRPVLSSTSRLLKSSRVLQYIINAMTLRCNTNSSPEY